MRWAQFWVFSAVAAAQGTGVSPTVIAHRGGAAHFPENTMAAFENALRLRAGMIEFDMGVTADGEIVIHHDTKVNAGICRSPEVRADSIHALTFRQIRTFDCGSNPPERFPGQARRPGERMPTLDELLERMKREPVDLLGETKMDPDGSRHFVDPGEFAAKVVAKLRKHGMTGRFILQSGDYRTLDAAKRLEPSLRVCLLNARRFRPRYLELAAKHKAAYLMLRLDDIDETDPARLRRAGLKLLSSTANAPGEWIRYRDLGFDGILTDAPGPLIDLLARKSAKGDR